MAGEVGECLAEEDGRMYRKSYGMSLWLVVFQTS